ncbi:MAG: RNase J family beta-CASP ribonuclease [Synergistaceae bacterium]|jgi:ribonuclease J|nr:RNase J family beta-CASP ribonuclease [Synergistaceae bacterium]
MAEKTRSTGRRKGGRGKSAGLRVIPLGGLGEVGKNMYVVEYEDDILVIDSGLMFPDQDLPGIDLIVPDISYLEANREKVLGIVLTHGHEDHTGGLSFVLQRLDVPIYGTKLTLGLVGNRLQEDMPFLTPQFREVKAGDVIDIGPFRTRFIAVSHSIPDGVALSIETPLGRIVHTGDFKLDSTPIDGRVTDYGALAGEGDKGVLLLLSDSTNAERNGFTPSERIIGNTLDSLYRNYRSKRLIVSSFASNVHRIQQVADGAARFNRKIAFLGRSMVRNVEIASKLGYLHVDEKMIAPVEDIGKIPPNQLVIMTTGSQGEPFSGLVMMSMGEHKQITLSERDAVFILASVIPGNEKLVNNTINRLFSIGCEVVYEAADKMTHVSGHASAEELKIMLNLVRPQYFVPIHGEQRHLARHAKLAEDVGIPPRNIFIMSNGDVLTFQKGAKPHVRDRVQAGAVLIDGNAVGEIKSRVMKERRDLAEDGIIVVSLALSEDGTLLAPIAIESRGLFAGDDANVFAEVEKAVLKALKDISSPHSRTRSAPRTGRQGKSTPRSQSARSSHAISLDVEAVSRSVKSRVSDVLRRRSSSYAVVLPLISVQGGEPRAASAADFLEREMLA